MTDHGTATGGCLCGSVRYAFSGKPIWVAHCHCASCRRNTGAAFATFVGLRSDAFTWTRGSAARFESSPGVFRSFCGSCGTPLTYEGKGYPGEVHVNIGSLDDPQAFPPRSHAYVREQLDWVQLADSLPRYATIPKEGKPLTATQSRELANCG